MKSKRNFAILGFLVLVLVVSFLVVPAETKAQSVDSQAQVTALTDQLNSLLKQLITLLTTQLQGLQAQLAVKLVQQPAVTPLTTPPAATTAEISTATAANIPPRVNIIYPDGGLEVSTPVDITASASDEDGSISKVEFFAGNTSIGTASGNIGPWTVRWTGAATGDYILTAKATDDKGAVGTSAPVAVVAKTLSEIAATAAGGFQDIPPSITIATTITGTALTATATVSTYAGSITNVVWSRAASTTSDAAYVTDATSPYNGAATLAVGQHTISAIVTNSQGTTARTASTTVTTN
ncbi:MAG: Ig-like domain-containing protein [Candidatus Colwellbacteria bacterium]|nr:Ig-like domain-containing protein [Candidatus Colwellbacteria bacterium]